MGLFGRKKKKQVQTMPKRMPVVNREYHLPDLNECVARHFEWAKPDISVDLGAIGKVFDAYGMEYCIEKYVQGPTLTQYTITLSDFRDYVKVSKLEKAFQAALNKSGVRISQDGAYINIEVPCFVDTLLLGDVLNDDKYMADDGLTVAIGRAVDGSNVLANIEELKHILVAGASGSGKSVFIQGMILSLLAKHTPNDLDIFLVDPKMVEFYVYRNIPNCHVVTETKDAIDLLQKLTTIMDDRYRQLAAAGCRDIDSYNQKNDIKMRRIVLFIDELADLIKTSRRAVEDNIVRIAQKARACGIHLVIATQYPKAEVVTGLIKSNIPTKVCFAVTSPTASVVMLGQGGAEKLIGKGDMLYQTEKDINPIRLQGAMVHECEINNIVYHWLREV